MKAALTVGGRCRKLGMNRQNYYRGRLQRRRREADGGLIEQLVRAERAVQPRLGGRKLYHILGPEPERAGAKDLCGCGGLVPRHGLRHLRLNALNVSRAVIGPG
jgi:hypothetical protein